MSVPYTVDLKGEVAVVTGGSGVLCSRMARALADCGASVAVLSRTQESVDRVAGDIVAAGGRAIGVACNVLDKPSLEQANASVEQAFGPVTILVNGAGGNHPDGTTTKEYLFPEDLEAAVAGVKTFFDLDPKGVEFVFNLNFLGTLLPTQAFTRGMARSGAGTVINISSMNAFRPLTKIPAYSGAKAAIDNFTRWLAVHFSKVGVRVNAIAPGFFVTEQNRALLVKPDGTWTPRAGKILAQTPMGRFGEPDELLGALLWLASRRASGFVTGTVIPVDGGFSAYSGV